MRVPSRVRLCSPNQVPGPIREELFYFFEIGAAVLHSRLEREANAFGIADVLIGEDRKDVVERIAQASENVPNINKHLRGQVAIDPKAPNFLRSLNIYLGDDFIWINRDKLANIGLEFVDSGFGPMGLLVAPRKRRFRFHDIGAFMSATKRDSDEIRLARLAKRLMDMPPKPREESKLRKHKGEKAVSPSRKRAKKKD